MVKNLEKDFKEYCINNNLEINKNQIEVIKKLENFSKKNFKPFLYKLFSSTRKYISMVAQRIEKLV